MGGERTLLALEHFGAEHEPGGDTGDTGDSGGTSVAADSVRIAQVQHSTYTTTGGCVGTMPLFDEVPYYLACEDAATGSIRPFSQCHATSSTLHDETPNLLAAEKEELLLTETSELGGGDPYPARVAVLSNDALLVDYVPFAGGAAVGGREWRWFLTCDPSDTTGDCGTDEDGDGYPADGDCNDSAADGASVHLGAAPIMWTDNNCDGWYQGARMISQARKLVLALGLAALVTLPLIFSARSEAQEPPLPGPAVLLRTQLQTFQTLRVFLAASIERFPKRFIVHLKADQQIALDGPGNLLRYTWKGSAHGQQQGLRSDQVGGPPPAMVPGLGAELIATIWQRLRGDGASWLARGPSHYGLAQPSTRMHVEVDLGDVMPAGHHLFILFGHQPPVPRRVDLYGPEGYITSIGILGIEFNPTLPALAFSPEAPPFRIEFPPICDGQICPGTPPL